MPELLFSFSPRLDGLRQGAEQLYRIVPAEAGVGDALAESERASRLEVLPAFDEMRFHHYPDDAPLAACNLAAEIGGNGRLAPIVLGRVGVRAIDHQPLGQPGARQLLARRLYRRRFVVRALAAAQDDVAVVVAPRLDDRHLAALVHR